MSHYCKTPLFAIEYSHVSNGVGAGRQISCILPQYNAVVTCTIFMMSKTEIILTSDHWRSALCGHKVKLLK